jgi:iron complex outermembrane receptor protein
LKTKITIIFTILLSIGIGYSQKNGKDTLNLSEVIVTGSKIEISRKIVPLSVSQISPKDIQNSGQLNILPILNSFVPGLFVTERNIVGFGVAAGGAGSISMRGISSSPNTDVLVLIDGHPQYQGIFGHPLADAYVASDVEKVEVIRGPASLLYGSNAMAGVINIITKKQNENGFKINAGASYGSFNTQKYYGTIGYKKEKLSAYASINHDQTDGIRTNTDFKINNGYTKLGYEINQHLSAIADFSLAKYNANDNGPINKAPAPFNIDITRGKTSFTLENKYEKSEGAIKLYHNFGTHDLSDGLHSTDRNSGAMIYQTFKLIKGNNLTIGTDFKQYGGIINQMAVKDSSIQKVIKDKLLTVDELAVYLYTQQNIFNKLTISGGLRIENNSKFGNELIPIGGLTYNLSEKTTFKTSISKGFRSPTIMELYLYAPNPDLQPERMINYEVSWMQSLFNKRLNIELTAFKVKGENLIQVVLPPPPPAKRQNIGSFDNQGIELSGKYIANKNLSFNANYSFFDLNKPVLAAPRQQFNFGANYSYKIWTVHFSAQHIDRIFTDISSATTQSYTLLNMRLSAKPLKHFEVFIAGNNLLNQQYEINYGYPMPGIYFNSGFNIRF